SLLLRRRPPRPCTLFPYTTLFRSNWATREMCRMIRRRDPTRPGFWYLSYCHPHPPLVPLPWYLDLYRDLDPPSPAVGAWAAGGEDRKSTRLNSSHVKISYAVFCLK